MKSGKTNLFSLFLVMVLAVVSIAACNDMTAHHATSHSLNPTSINTKAIEPSCRTVKLTMGETCVPNNPQRIVTLFLSTAATALALGIKPVASEIGDYWRAEDIPYLVGKTNGIEFLHSSGEFSLEKLLSLHPDLIIALSLPKARATYELLSQIAPTVLLPWEETSGDWKLFLQDVAAVFDKTEKANQLIDDYYRRVKGLKQKLGDHRQQIRVSVIYLRDGGIVTNGKLGFSTKILDDIGLKYPPSLTTNAKYTLPISEEYLHSIDGDILLVVSHPEREDFLEQLQQKPLWQQLKAVQTKQVYIVDPNVWDAQNILAAHAVLDDIEKYIVNTP
ncbi:iron-siderophore ABC transporter substrate-binding protein [Chlorogloeopsis sp. ULAP02]|uniref:iron-siderophore ABC transporter substrate-binding protein n=1 Tax=Chlorogloeopsis sp. ULAP02 TaxID=3107926 RepID=UPI003134F455